MPHYEESAPGSTQQQQCSSTPDSADLRVPDLLCHALTSVSTGIAHLIVAHLGRPAAGSRQAGVGRAALTAGQTNFSSELADATNRCGMAVLPRVIDV